MPTVNIVEVLIMQTSLNEKRFHLLIKRLFDVLFSLLMLLICSPVFIITAILIRLTSRGPVFYNNFRVGLHGRKFKCYKFRSMYFDNCESPDNPSKPESSKDGILLKKKNDCRVTLIGKIIRRTSIDELPQFINVLIGEMTVIGPRPLLRKMLDVCPEFKEIRCLVKPGITGLWQIKARAKNTSARYMEVYDIDYIKKFSIWFDLKILLQTPYAVLSCKGAF